MNSIELHAVLTSTFDKAKSRIQSETGFTGPVGISVWAGDMYGKDISVNIRTGYGTSFKEVEVAGRDFWDCVREFINRVQFAQRQSTLTLGPPTIDG